MCPVMSMIHDTDPVDEIVNRIGDLSDVVIPANKVLLGIYMRPSKTKSGLHIPDKYREEDFYQGKAGLVLKCGPAAFKGSWKVEAFEPKIGDWVAFRPSDGFKIDIRSQEGHCILLEDTSIQLILPAPDLVF